MTDEKYIQVQNLSSGIVVYTIPEDNIRRVFRAHETKKISAEELRKLYYQSGGATLIQHFLSVKDRNLALEFGVSADSFDHEYSWTPKDVENLLTDGSLDTLHDALDFAPEGIIDLIIDRAIALQIPDVNKRELIQRCTGKNISQMIATQKALNEILGTDEKDNKPKQRRSGSKPNAASATVGRRAQ